MLEPSLSASIIPRLSEPQTCSIPHVFLVKTFSNVNHALLPTIIICIPAQHHQNLDLHPSSPPGPIRERQQWCPSSLHPESHIVAQFKLAESVHPVTIIHPTLDAEVYILGVWTKHSEDIILVGKTRVRNFPVGADQLLRILDDQEHFGRKGNCRYESSICVDLLVHSRELFTWLRWSDIWSHRRGSCSVIALLITRPSNFKLIYRRLLWVQFLLSHVALLKTRISIGCPTIGNEVGASQSTWGRRHRL